MKAPLIEDRRWLDQSYGEIEKQNIGAGSSVVVRASLRALGTSDTLENIGALRE